MKLNQLPDDCMLELFHRIPLSKRMRSIQLVCRRWRHMHLLTCRHRTTTVALFENNCRELFYGIHMHPSLCHENYHLTLGRNFTFRLVGFLLDLFPNISRLELIQRSNNKQTDKMVRLLGGLSEKIVNLKLYFFSKNRERYFARDEDNTPVYKLMEEVLHRGKLPQLRNVTFYIDCDMVNYPNDAPLFDVSKLEDISLLKMSRNVQRILLQGNNCLFTSLRRLAFDRSLLHKNDNTILNDFAQRYFSQLTHLTVYSFRKTIFGLIRDFCDKLTYLHLEVVPMMPLIKFTGQLGDKVASNLKCLKIEFDQRDDDSDFLPTSVIDFSRKLWSRKDGFTDRLVFPSFRTLILRARKSILLPASANRRACILLSSIFPALTSLTIDDTYSHSAIPTPAHQLLDAFEHNRDTESSISNQEFKHEKAQLLGEMETLLSGAITRSDLEAIRLAKKNIQEAINTSNMLIRINSLAH